MAKTFTYLIGFFLLILIFIFYINLQKSSENKLSTNINKKISNTLLVSLSDGEEKDIMKLGKGNLLVLHFWSAWCVNCKYELPFLFLLQEKKDIKLIGINYKDSLEEAKDWLKNYGNPFTEILIDSEGKFGMDIGVTGVPETYLLDNNGNIVFKWSGVLNSLVWDENFAKIIFKLKKETDA